MLKKMLFLFALLMACNYAYSQTVEEIYANNMKARGGDKFVNYKTKIVKMASTMQGIDVKTKIFREGSDKLRVETTAEGQKEIAVLNGEHGWVSSGTEAKELKKTQLNLVKSQDFTNTDLRNYKTRFKSLECLGKVKVDGIEAYKMKIVTKEDKEFSLYINAETYLEHKVSSTVEGTDNQEHEIEVFYSKYKSFDGCKFPTKIELKGDGSAMQTMYIDDMDIDKTIDAKNFERPY